MKRILNIAARIASIAAVCFAATACEKNPGKTEPANLEATVSITAVTETTMTATVNVQDGATGYTYAIGQASDADSFADGTMEGIMTQEDASISEVTFDGLTPDTQYTIFARAFNAAGETGSVAKASRKTAAEEQAPDLNLVATLTENDITEESFMIRLTCTEDMETIEYGVGTADDQEAFENGTLEGIKTTTPSNSLIVSGLERNTEYTVFLRAKAGDLVGPTVSVTGSTLQVDLSLEQIEVTASSAKIKVTPANDAVRFKYTTGPEGIDELFISGQWPDISWAEATEATTITVTGLSAASTNVFYAQPYASNGARGELQKLTFKTLDK